MNLSKTFLLSQLAASSASLLRGATKSAEHRELQNNRIINGKAAIEDRYSYAVSLQDDMGHFCGGSLIAPDVVLSAAHCAGGDYKAVIGRHALADTDGEEIAIKADGELMHPEYDGDTTNNDFMLLFLESSTTQDLDLVQVSSNFIPAGQQVTVMGWGDVAKADDVKTLAEELMEVEVTTITNEECDASSSNETGWEYSYNGQITSNMMCAEHASDKDACQGDSGGPLVIKADSGDVQIGVVSWGIGCAHDDFPGVYARISAQYVWIRKNVCEGSAAPPASFDCAGYFASISTARTVDTTAQPDTQKRSTWTTVIQEDFATGFGLFNRHGNNAKFYTTAKRRSGVVRIADGEEGKSQLTSNNISLQNSSFNKYKVEFEFYAIEMEHSDKLCIDLIFDDGITTGEKCWSSLHAFDNHQWYSDKYFEFTAPNASSLKVRFRIDGDDAEDDVLIDSVTISGQA